MADFDKNRFNSKSVEYETPDSVFAPLDEEFGFTRDVAATSENAKCEQFFTRGDDALKKKWKGVCWCNPPYGRELPLWIKKAMRCARKGWATTVMLIPARTNTGWWHDLVMKYGEVRFVRGRPKFNDGKHGLPFPLAVVIFRRKDDQLP